MSGSRRKALLMTVGWWLLRRKLRRRAGTAVAGFLAGEGLRPAPRKRHIFRNLVILAGVGAAGFVVWKRLQGGSGDDWGTWEPEPPAPAPPAEPVPAPAVA